MARFHVRRAELHNERRTQEQMNVIYVLITLLESLRLHTFNIKTPKHMQFNFTSEPN